MANPPNVELEAAKFLHKLIQDSKDEPTKLATKLYVILQHMRSSGKENSMPYQVISRAMETVIKQNGLDIEALMSSRLPLAAGPQVGESGSAHVAASSERTGVMKDPKASMTANEMAKPDSYSSGVSLIGHTSTAHDMYQGSPSNIMGGAGKVRGLTPGAASSYQPVEAGMSIPMQFASSSYPNQGFAAKMHKDEMEAYAAVPAMDLYAGKNMAGKAMEHEAGANILPIANKGAIPSNVPETSMIPHSALRDTGKAPVTQAPVSGLPFKEHHLKQLRAQCLVFLAFRNGLLPKKLHLDIALGNFFPKEDGARKEMIDHKGKELFVNEPTSGVIDNSRCTPSIVPRAEGNISRDADNKTSMKEDKSGYHAVPSEHAEDSRQHSASRRKLEAEMTKQETSESQASSLRAQETDTEEEDASANADRPPLPKYTTSEKWILDRQKRKLCNEKMWALKQQKTEQKRIVVCSAKLKESVSSSEDIFAKTKSVIELKKLQLLEWQRRLRSDILNDFFKPIAPEMDRLKSIKKHRIGRRSKQLERYEQKMKEERQKRIRERQKEFFSEVEVHRERLEDVFKMRRERVKGFNKYVREFHKRKERIHREKIDRIQREKINLLKINDVEGYLRMVQDAKSDRVKQLLKETEKYLQKLGSKLQEAKSVARDVDESRFTTATEKNEISVENEDETDQAKHYLESNEKYYMMAHSVKENVLEQPAMLVRGKLREYQMNGLRWLVSLYNNQLNGILADEMGLGKTVQVISLLCHLMETKNDRGPFLIVVPSSVLPGWESEISFWAPGIHKIVYSGPPEERRKLFKEQIVSQKFNVLLTTYEYLMNKHDRPKLSKVQWHYIIIDEGHRIKNASCKLNAELKHYRSNHRLLLTGTPLQNNLEELWALLNFLLPNIFNSSEDFSQWFNKPFESNGDNSLDEALLSEEENLLIINRLHQVLRPFVLRRLKHKVENELPEKIERLIRCEASSYQKLLMKRVEENLGAIGTSKARSVHNSVMELRNICNHPYLSQLHVEEVHDWIPEHYLPNMIRLCGKLEMLDRLLPKLKATDHRVLLFSTMTRLLDVMEDYLCWKQYKYLRLDGHTSGGDRGALIDKFNQPGSPFFIFLLSIRAGGVGVNLQAADTVIIFDTDWNPQVDLQAQARAHRIGQKREVLVLRLETVQTVEEQVRASAEHKLGVANQSITAGFFDNNTSAEDRREYLESLLRECKKEEATPVLGDDALNDVIARSESEIDIFESVDKKRREEEMGAWRKLVLENGAQHPEGLPPLPSRLLTDDDLKPFYDAMKIFEEPQQGVPSSSGMKRKSGYLGGLDTQQYGRGKRAREVRSYEEQWTEEEFEKLCQAESPGSPQVKEEITEKKLSAIISDSVMLTNETKVQVSQQPLNAQMPQEPLNSQMPHAQMPQQPVNDQMPQPLKEQMPQQPLKEQMPQQPLKEQMPQQPLKEQMPQQPLNHIVKPAAEPSKEVTPPSKRGRGRPRRTTTTDLSHSPGVPLASSGAQSMNSVKVEKESQVVSLPGGVHGLALENSFPVTVQQIGVESDPGAQSVSLPSVPTAVQPPTLAFQPVTLPCPSRPVRGRGRGRKPQSAGEAPRRRGRRLSTGVVTAPTPTMVGKLEFQLEGAPSSMKTCNPDPASQSSNVPESTEILTPILHVPLLPPSAMSKSDLESQGVSVSVSTMPVPEAFPGSLVTPAPSSSSTPTDAYLSSSVTVGAAQQEPPARTTIAVSPVPAPPFPSVISGSQSTASVHPAPARGRGRGRKAQSGVEAPRRRGKRQNPQVPVSFEVPIVQDTRSVEPPEKRSRASVGRRPTTRNRQEHDAQKQADFSSSSQTITDPGIGKLDIRTENEAGKPANITRLDTSKSFVDPIGPTVDDTQDTEVLKPTNIAQTGASLGTAEPSMVQMDKDNENKTEDKTDSVLSNASQSNKHLPVGQVCDSKEESEAQKQINSGNSDAPRVLTDPPTLQEGKNERESEGRRHENVQLDLSAGFVDCSVTSISQYEQETQAEKQTDIIHCDPCQSGEDGIATPASELEENRTHKSASDVESDAYQFITDPSRGQGQQNDAEGHGDTSQIDPSQSVTDPAHFKFRDSSGVEIQGNLAIESNKDTEIQLDTAGMLSGSASVSLKEGTAAPDSQVLGDISDVHSNRTVPEENEKQDKHLNKDFVSVLSSAEKACILDSAQNKSKDIGQKEDGNDRVTGLDEVGLFKLELTAAKETKQRDSACDGTQTSKAIDAPVSGALGERSEIYHDKDEATSMSNLEETAPSTILVLEKEGLVVQPPDKNCDEQSEKDIERVQDENVPNLSAPSFVVAEFCGIDTESASNLSENMIDLRYTKEEESLRLEIASSDVIPAEVLAEESEIGSGGAFVAEVQGNEYAELHETVVVDAEATEAQPCVHLGISAGKDASSNMSKSVAGFGQNIEEEAPHAPSVMKIASGDPQPCVGMGTSEGKDASTNMSESVTGFGQDIEEDAPPSTKVLGEDATPAEVLAHKPVVETGREVVDEVKGNNRVVADAEAIEPQPCLNVIASEGKDGCANLLENKVCLRESIDKGTSSLLEKSCQDGTPAVALAEKSEIGSGGGFVSGVLGSERTELDITVATDDETGEPLPCTCGEASESDGSTNLLDNMVDSGQTIQEASLSTVMKISSEDPQPCVDMRLSEAKDASTNMSETMTCFSQNIEEEAPPFVKIVIEDVIPVEVLADKSEVGTGRDDVDEVTGDQRDEDRTVIADAKASEPQPYPGATGASEGKDGSANLFESKVDLRQIIKEETSFLEKARQDATPVVALAEKSEIGSGEDFVSGVQGSEKTELNSTVAADDETSEPLPYTYGGASSANLLDNMVDPRQTIEVACLSSVMKIASEDPQPCVDMGTSEGKDASTNAWESMGGFGQNIEEEAPQEPLDVKIVSEDVTPAEVLADNSEVGTGGDDEEVNRNKRDGVKTDFANTEASEPQPCPTAGASEGKDGSGNLLENKVDSGQSLEEETYSPFKEACQDATLVPVAEQCDIGSGDFGAGVRGSEGTELDSTVVADAETNEPQPYGEASASEVHIGTGGDFVTGVQVSERTELDSTVVADAETNEPQPYGEASASEDHIGSEGDFVAGVRVSERTELDSTVVADAETDEPQPYGEASASEDHIGSGGDFVAGVRVSERTELDSTVVADAETNEPPPYGEASANEDHIGSGGDFVAGVRVSERTELDSTVVADAETNEPQPYGEASASEDHIGSGGDFVAGLRVSERTELDSTVVADAETNEPQPYGEASASEDHIESGGDFVADVRGNERTELDSTVVADAETNELQPYAEASASEDGTTSVLDNMADSRQTSEEASLSSVMAGQDISPAEVFDGSEIGCGIELVAAEPGTRSAEVDKTTAADVEVTEPQSSTNQSASESKDGLQQLVEEYSDMASDM